MRIRLVSDLHLEYLDPAEIQLLLDQVTDGRPPRVLLLAGDVCEFQHLCAAGADGESAARFMRKLCAWAPQVLWVPGNHERYGIDATQDQDWQRRALDVIDRRRLTILDRSVWRLGNVRILGATLYWSKPPPKAGIVRDYLKVQNLEPWVYEQGDADEKFLFDEVKAGDLVVTHLMPCHKSISPAFAGDPGNHFFYRPMEVLFPRKPAIWAHGHTHQPADYVHEDVRVVCNPKGYRNEKQFGLQFRPTLDLDV